MSLNCEIGGENKSMTMTEHERYLRFRNNRNEIERAIFLDLVKSWHKKSNYVDEEQYEKINGYTQVIQIWNMDEYRTNYIVHLKYSFDTIYSNHGRDEVDYLLHLQIEECLGCDCGGFVRIIYRDEYATMDIRTTFLVLVKNEFNKSYPYDHFGRYECSYENSIRQYKEIHNIDDW